jgi:hypothetical protein
MVRDLLRAFTETASQGTEEIDAVRPVDACDRSKCDSQVLRIRHREAR